MKEKADCREPYIERKNMENKVIESLWRDFENKEDSSILGILADVMEDNDDPLAVGIRWIYNNKRWPFHMPAESYGGYIGYVWENVETSNDPKLKLAEIPNKYMIPLSQSNSVTMMSPTTRGKIPSILFPSLRIAIEELAKVIN